MKNSHRINPLLRRFEHPDVENEFKKFVFDDNLATNKLGTVVGVPLFLLYCLIDLINLPQPTTAIFIRAGAAFVCLCLYLAMRSKRFQIYHESLAATVAFVVGTATVIIIWTEPSLENAYYVGLIQIGVFLTFLSRMTFYKAILPLPALLALFIFAVAGKEDRSEALLQLLVLATMFSIFTFGIYVSDNLRRKDFLKARIIRRQNDKLEDLLKEARDDTARKVAALKLLVHYVKTPIHQIVGFTDLITTELGHDENGPPKEAHLQNAAFLRDASHELAQNVSRLLAYYRLDDRAPAPPEPIEIRERVRDFLERIGGGMTVKVTGGPAALVVDSTLVDAALIGIVDYFNTPPFEDCALEADVESDGDIARVRIRHSGPALTSEEFQSLTRPIEYIGEYLAARGSSFPLSLRTAARAATLCGGGLRLIEDGRSFEISFSASNASIDHAYTEPDLFAA